MVDCQLSSRPGFDTYIVKRKNVPPNAPVPPFDSSIAQLGVRARQEASKKYFVYGYNSNKYGKVSINRMNPSATPSAAHSKYDDDSATCKKKKKDEDGIDSGVVMTAIIVVCVVIGVCCIIGVIGAVIYYNGQKRSISNVHHVSDDFADLEDHAEHSKLIEANEANRWR